MNARVCWMSCCQTITRCQTYCHSCGTCAAEVQLEPAAWLAPVYATPEPLLLFTHPCKQQAWQQIRIHASGAGSPQDFALPAPRPCMLLQRRRCLLLCYATAAALLNLLPLTSGFCVLPGPRLCKLLLRCRCWPLPVPGTAA
jgi:hypothetical protein